MLINKDFIFIHVPKTGGTFVEYALHCVRRNLIPPYLRWMLLFSSWLLQIHPKYGAYIGKWVSKIVCPVLPLWSYGSHAVCRRIPKKYQSIRILSTVRDPLYYYASCFGAGRYYDRRNAEEYAVWDWLRIYKGASNEGGGLPDFNEFLRFCNGALLKEKALKWVGIQIPSSIGLLTLVYIDFFFKNPTEVLLKSDEELKSYFRSGEYKKDMHNVEFLCMENLNRELHDFMSKLEIDKKHIDFILTARKLNNSNNNHQSQIISSCSKEMIEQIKEKDYIYYRYFYQPAVCPQE